MADWVDRLLAEHKAAPLTIMQYAAGLRYWDAWHKIRYGVRMPLADIPPSALKPDVVDAFIDDHLAIALDGRLAMRIGSLVLDSLRAEGCNLRVDCVAPATSIWRLHVLQIAHSLMNLQLDCEQIRQRKPEIHAAWRAERAALGISMTLPMSASTTVEALINVCGDDRDGVMDVALILFLCRLTPSQAAAVRFSELTPGTVVRDGEELDFVRYVINAPFGAMQKAMPVIQFAGRPATLIKAWGALREDEVQGCDDLFFVRKARRNTFPALDHGWIARRLRILAQQAGLADASGRTQVSPQWLRKAHEREWREDSNLVRTARAAGVNTRTVLHMLRRA